jgi:hypothetical protein
MACASPVMAIVFVRPVAPDFTDTADFATRSVSAISRTSASLALPLSGTARTRAFKTADPSAKRAIPSIASVDDFGVSRTDSSSSPALIVQGAASPAMSKAR